MTVKEYYYPAFAFPDFLSKLGGSLGLWLGIGAIQIATQAAEIMARMKTFFKTPNMKF